MQDFTLSWQLIVHLILVQIKQKQRRDRGNMDTIKRWLHHAFVLFCSSSNNTWHVFVCLFLVCFFHSRYFLKFHSKTVVQALNCVWWVCNFTDTLTKLPMYEYSSILIQIIVVYIGTYGCGTQTRSTELQKVWYPPPCVKIYHSNFDWFTGSKYNVWYIVEVAKKRRLIFK